MTFSTWYRNCVGGAVAALVLFNGSLAGATDDSRSWEEMQNDYLIELIAVNVDDLKYCSTSNGAATELVYLLEEGYRFDSKNMLTLIELLADAQARKNAAYVLMQALDYRSELTPEHMIMLFKQLDNAGARSKASEIALYAIDLGVPVGPFERYVLAQMSKQANARKDVEKIRAAIHQREVRAYHST